MARGGCLTCIMMTFTCKIMLVQIWKMVFSFRLTNEFNDMNLFTLMLLGNISLERTVVASPVTTMINSMNVWTRFRSNSWGKNIVREKCLGNKI